MPSTTTGAPQARTRPPRNDPEAERRRIAHTVMAGELREPVAAIVRSLHRLSLQHVSPVPGPDGRGSAQLVRRARHLAGELQEVIDELLGGPTEGAGREPQQTVLVLGVLEDALAEARPRLGGRRVEVDCPDQLAATTHPTRFVHLVTCLVAEATSRTGAADAVALRAHRRRGELLLEVSGPADLHEPATARRLELLVEIARSLGGDADDRPTGLTVRLPQQRSRDGDLTAPPRDAERAARAAARRRVAPRTLVHPRGPAQQAG